MRPFRHLNCVLCQNSVAGCSLRERVGLSICRKITIHRGASFSGVVWLFVLLINHRSSHTTRLSSSGALKGNRRESICAGLRTANAIFTIRRARGDRAQMRRADTSFIEISMRAASVSVSHWRPAGWSSFSTNAVPSTYYRFAHMNLAVRCGSSPQIQPGTCQYRRCWQR